MTPVRPLRFDASPPVDAAEASTVQEWYATPDGRFSAGFWAHAGGVIDVTYTEDEFCHLLEGTVRLTDAGGTVDTYHAGDGFLIPRGFVGTWESVGKVRKWYVIYQEAAA